jgi:small subunit ribosomal protein S4e
MSGHQKRLTAPNAWCIAKKANKFITKTAPGPHTMAAMPVSVWLRDHMGIARNMKEIKKILSSRSVIVNGKPARDPKLGIGVFDIISIPAMQKHYRILLDKKGNLVSIEITEDAAKTRLCKIRNKTEVKGGKVQINLRYGANLIADHSYRPRDSVVLSLEESNRFAIVDHFPFATGYVAMVIGGRHSGKVGRIFEITDAAGSIPNKVILDELETGTRFDTIDAYVFMVGKEEPAVKEWGIE